MFSCKMFLDKVHSHAPADGISRLVAPCACSLTFRITDVTVDPRDFFVCLSLYIVMFDAQKVLTKFYLQLQKHCTLRVSETCCFCGSHQLFIFIWQPFRACIHQPLLCSTTGLIFPGITVLVKLQKRLD